MLKSRIIPRNRLTDEHHLKSFQRFESRNNILVNYHSRYPLRYHVSGVVLDEVDKKLRINLFEQLSPLFAVKYAITRKS